MDLRQIRQARRDIDLLRERIDCINADIQRVTAVPRNMPGGGGASDGLAGKVAKLVDLRRELVDKCIEHEDAVSCAVAALDRLDCAEQYILSLRYIKGLPWRLVARESNYHVRTCLKMHERAMCKLGMRRKRAMH